MIQFSDKVSKLYKLCIITEVELMYDGVVRTVTMGLRNRRVWEFKHLPLKLKRMKVQCLALILPVSEQNKEEEQMTRKFTEEAKVTSVL